MAAELQGGHTHAVAVCGGQARHRVNEPGRKAREWPSRAALSATGMPGPHEVAGSPAGVNGAGELREGLLRAPYQKASGSRPPT
jgi:hypothetical protein